MTRCPRCGNVVKLLSAGKMRSFRSLNEGEWKRFTICRLGENDALLLMSGYAHRDFSHYDLRPVPEISWKRFTYLAPGKRMQWERSWEPRGQNVSGSWLWGFKWRPLNTVGEPFAPGGAWSASDGDSVFLNTFAIDRSSLKYSQVEEWAFAAHSESLCMEKDPLRDVIKYLSAYTRYPNLEMAMKVGIPEAASELVIKGKKNHKYLNWDGKNLPEFLRLSKQDTKAFLQKAEGLNVLIAYHRAKQCGMVKNMDEFLYHVKGKARLDLAEKLVTAAEKAGCTLQVAANYLARQPDGIDRVITTWIDYLNMAAILEYDCSRKDVVMPRNLKDRHDAASETVRYQRITVDENKNKKYNDYLKKMYEFEYGGLKIVIPRGVEDIISEGKTLRHCVGGYAARHFDNKLHILFVRKVRKPWTPFITMEINTRELPKSKVVIRQIHGYRNEGYLTGISENDPKNNARPAVKYKWFLDIWRAWVEAGSRRDKKGRPILPNSEEKSA